MKALIGLLVAVLLGAGCRLFDIPVSSPSVVPSALLVVAMTFRRQPGRSFHSRFAVRTQLPGPTSEDWGWLLPTKQSRRIGWGAS